MVVNMMLSVSVTVRRITWSTVSPTGRSSNHRPDTGRWATRLVIDGLPVAELTFIQKRSDFRQVGVPRSMSVSPDAVRTAACELFARQGYRGTSMKDIGGALAVSAPNLYNHVPNKQDLLVVIMDTAMDRAHSALDEALTGI